MSINTIDLIDIIYNAITFINKNCIIFVHFVVIKTNGHRHAQFASDSISTNCTMASIWLEMGKSLSTNCFKPIKLFL